MGSTQLNLDQESPQKKISENYNGDSN